MTIKVSIRINGKPASAEVENRTLLVQLLREKLGLTGTHVGCDTSQCGACVVHVNGTSVKSCTMLAVQADGAKVTTIDGLRADFSDGFGLVRASNTTPVLVLRFEGHTPEALERIRAHFMAAILAVKPDAHIGAGH